MKKVKIGTKMLDFENGYVISNISDGDGPSLDISYYDNPETSGGGVSKLRVSKKKINIVGTLRKPTGGEFFNEILELKEECLDKEVDIEITRDGLTGDIEMVGIGVVESITINDNIAGGTFGVINISITIPNGFLQSKNGYSISSELDQNFAGYTFSLTGGGNHKIIPVISLTNNGSNLACDQIRIEVDGLFIENLPITIDNGKTIEFNFQKNKVYYDGLQVDNRGRLSEFPRLSQVEIKFYKNGSLAYGPDINFSMTITGKENYI